MSFEPTKPDSNHLTNTINESYDTALKDRSSLGSHEYVSMDLIRDSFTDSVVSGQGNEVVPGCDKKSSDMKFHFVCVILGVVAIVLLLVSLACAISALWLSTKSGPDIMKLEESKGSQVIGLEESNPAASCFFIHLLHPFSPSGFYWVKTSAVSAVRVYCDMTRSCGGVTGGWRRVASLDFSNGSIPCSTGLKERGDSGIRTCGIGSSNGACVSVMFPSSGISYTRVCGSIIAYQFGNTDVFADLGFRTAASLDSNYVDGVSLTYGRPPRTHIWTFAAALDDVPSIPISSCQCMSPNLEGIPPSPSFVGEDYFCATGSRIHDSSSRFYELDPLWDGLGCAVNSTCCSFNNPPWFYKKLPSSTTEDIEMRVCSDEKRQNEDIALSQIEIYVQ